tara:strand:- start:94 stop:429 length:336 start_codon:yes stop_codon:yes gene_type:complete
MSSGARWILSPAGQMSRIFLPVATACVTILLALSRLGCVETAECDQSITCDDSSKVCFRYECKQVCAYDEDCNEGESCQSCEANDACFGMMLRACVADEQMSMMEDMGDGD